MASRTRLLLAAIALGIVPTGCGSHNVTPTGSTAGSPPPALHGAVPAAQVARPEFTLRDTSGHRYDFRARTGGRVTLLYAGYTHCPDECPTTMADIASALRRLPRAAAEQVVVVFVTTDPRRDSERVIRRWLNRFHPPTPYVGLTGAPSQLAHVETDLGMPAAQRQQAPKSYGAGGYAVTHFDGLLAYGRNDRLVTIYPFGTTPGAIAADLRLLVEGG